MLMLPKLNKGIKQAMTKLEKACKVIVGVTLVVGLSSIGIQSAEAHVGVTSSTISVPPQSSMLLTPASDGRLILARHYSHSSHASHASHASHYSSRY